MEKTRIKKRRDNIGPQRPEWFKIRLRTDGEYRRVADLVSKLSLNTVCREARCPNIYECWAQGTATFLILGEVCSRRCGFCSVTKGKPETPDPREPDHIAQAVYSLQLEYAVITSVTRDDLPDGGSGHFAGTIQAVKKRSPQNKVEVLVPDFGGNMRDLETVLEAGPDCLAHNVETVRDLYGKVRPAASYGKTLKILEYSVEWRDRLNPGMTVKSGIMAGLGETTGQLLDTLRDIARTGCDILTVGQYLPPQKGALPLARYYSLQEFEKIEKEGLEMGFKHVESGPLVRSSYHAKTQSETVTCRSVRAEPGTD